MHTGMLWFGSTKKTFAENLQDAINYYKNKYKRKPDLCLVHPSTLKQGANPARSQEVCGLTVRLYRPVLPGHIWIGIEDKQPERAA